MNNPRVIVALDFSNRDSVMTLVKQLDASLCRLKVGKELFTSCGPSLVEELIELGFDVFLDMKFHDIPNTVARACDAASRLGVWMLTVHAAGGREMLSRAREAVDHSGNKPLLVGVTVLTSMLNKDLQETGIRSSTETQVMRLAHLCRETGLDGVICSAMEVEQLRKEFGDQFCLVTPGIRPAGTDQNDQRRIVTPAEAVRLGSNYLVIGRPITRAKDPLKALFNIATEIENVIRDPAADSGAH